jgi:hypothetical protein
VFGRGDIGVAVIVQFDHRPVGEVRHQRLDHRIQVGVECGQRGEPLPEFGEKCELQRCAALGIDVRGRTVPALDRPVLAALRDDAREKPAVHALGSA